MPRLTETEELIRQAEYIRSIAKNYSDAVRVLNSALSCLQENRMLCRELQLEAADPAAETLEKVLVETKEQSRYLAALLEEHTAQYAALMEKIQVPVLTPPQDLLFTEKKG